MAKLVPVFIDLETFYSKDHSLGKVNPVVYCTHPETEIICAAVKVGKEPTCVSFGQDEVVRRMKAYDWSDKYVIGHNLSEFDAMILAWRCGVRPAMWGCTYAMARCVLTTVDGPLSLAALSKRFQIGVKHKEVLANTKGRHLKDFTPAEIDAMREYNRADVDLCAALFARLLPSVSRDELRIIDQTVRMLVAPKLMLDVMAYKTVLEQARKENRERLLKLAHTFGSTTEDKDAAIEVVHKVLGSAPKLAQFLESRGVTPPMKPSPANPEKQTYAFAKTDTEFMELLEHPNPDVATAVQARLKTKSTQLETRLQTFLDVSARTGGRLPVPLRYYGAITGRDSGTFGMNMQNLPRVDGRLSDVLRMGLLAPQGHSLIVSDLSNIELRVNMFLWQVPYAMERLSADPEGADLYREMASAVFHVRPEEVSKHQRQAGKAMHLGCGFGLGTPEVFVGTARQLARIEITRDEAAEYIAAYRQKHPEVARGWQRCQAALQACEAGSKFEIDPGGLCHAGNKCIVTPLGKIRYPGLRQEMDELRRRPSWMYGSSRKVYLYGGKVCENIVQHLARLIIMGYALDIKARTGHNPVLRVHDELVYVVPDAEAEQHLQTVLQIMRTPPEWWPQLPVWAEGGIAKRYGEAK